MKRSTLSASAISLLTASMAIHAEASIIDFVYPTVNGELDKTMQVNCSLGGNTFSGNVLERAVRFDVSEMLSGSNSGSHDIVCAASLSNESYEIGFDSVKFEQGEYGSYAPSYNNSGFGSGVKTKLVLGSCYDPEELNFDGDCLNTYYGDKPYYLEGTLGPVDTQWHFDSYSSAVGVFLRDNPQN